MLMHFASEPGRGEDPDPGLRPYRSTRQRRTAQLASIQLPILIWMLCAYALSAHLFGLDVLPSLAAAAVCGYVIFLVERLVIAAPRSKLVTSVRLVLTVLMSGLGACVFDLMIFQKDIEAQLHQDAVVEFIQRKQPEIDGKATAVETKKANWEDSLKKANCEADGSCGSGRRQIGPIWRELKQQADQKREDYMAATRELEALKTRVDQDARALSQSEDVVKQAGVATRLHALHRYISERPAAQIGWVVLFVVVMMLEASVLAAKHAFGETADEEFERLRETIALRQANRYAQALDEPVDGAKREGSQRK